MRLSYVFCDLDGTLCDCKHRQHLAQAGQWDEFHSLLEKDGVRQDVLSFLDMILSLRMNGLEAPKIVFLTGRPQTVEQQTMLWLLDAAAMFPVDDYETILMRPENDFRSDTVLKEELLQEFLADKNVTPSAVLILDDRDKVVAHLRDKGYNVWQIQEGAF